jgi:hypothetical protein
MGKPLDFTPHKLVIGVLRSGEDKREVLHSVLENTFGPIDFISETLPFTYTSYYQNEMGNRIDRYFLSFKPLVMPDRLSEIKLTANGLEEKFAVENKRTVNIDPGLLALSRFTLATTKDNAHRIALQNGIYGELTLLYTRKDFQTLPWTYPDYATREYRDILIKIREIYKENLKQ